MAHVNSVAGFLLPALLVPIAVGSPGTAAIATLHSQSRGAFAESGRMITARYGHSATVLTSGEVLIAGGRNNAVLANTEIFHPGEGTFRAGAVMTAARQFHSATLLPDERVLVAGGYSDGNNASASAEIFDPATATFTATGSLGVARAGHTSVLLPTGEVLVIGGYGTRAYPNLAPAEIFNPATGTFRAAGPYIGRGGCDFCAPAVALNDGTVLFVGQSPAQLYNPGNDTFTPGGMPTTEFSGATLMTNGQVLLAGGAPIGRLDNADVYSPATRTFVPTAKMALRRVSHTLTALPGGAVLAAGGETEACSTNSCIFAGSTATAELYVLADKGFQPTGSLNAARGGHTATLLRDGRVLMASGVAYGGIGLFYGSLDTTELYRPDPLVPLPALVPASDDARGQGVIFHAGTNALASRDDPAAPGDSVDIACTGLPDHSALFPRVVIGGRLAAVSSVSRTLGAPGTTLLRTRVPNGIAHGPAVVVRLIYLDVPSAHVTMAVR